MSKEINEGFEQPPESGDPPKSVENTAKLHIRGRPSADDPRYLGTGYQAEDEDEESEESSTPDFPEESSTTTTPAPQNSKSSTSNAFNTEFRREANENELRLDVQKEAQALSHVFQTADRDFCLGIFGRWGRGKSTLLGILQEILKKPDAKRFPKYAEYEIVDFSAWKYRTIPEVWVHLYESFADVAANRGFLQRFPITFRANVLRHGFWPLILALVLFGWAMIPLGYKLGLAVEFLQIVSLGSAIYLFSLFQGAKKSGLIDSLWKYATLSRHKEKLGLQAAIGADLKALINGWMPQDALMSKWAAWRWRLAYFVATVFVAAVLIWRAWGLDGFWGIATTVLAVLVSIGLLVLGVLMWTPIREGNSNTKQPHRLLLCVDDLDRCEPETMLEIVESLKLLLDDNEINSRLQVIFLVDRHILNLAILKKYGALVKPEFTKEQWKPEPADWVIRENHEKCFSAHFELLPLEPEDLTALIDSYTNAEKRSVTPGKESRIEPGDEVFTATDREVLEKTVDCTEPALVRDCSPRRLRYLMSQYQIAKLLLREHGVELNQDVLQQIGNKLAKVIVSGERLSRDDIEDDHSALPSVIQQVTGPFAEAGRP